MTYLFVGERPSARAARTGATWHNGRLAAKQLHDALRACDLDPAVQQYVNLWRLPERCDADAADELRALEFIRCALAAGITIVGMGHLVCAVLKREQLEHLQLVHPAARGAIRKKERYSAHVASVLSVDLARQEA